MKDIRHVVIDIGGSGIAYRPGDALGVLPCNDPALVDAVLAAAGCAGDEPVESGGGPRPLREALLRRCDLTRPRAALAERLGMPAARAGGGVDVLDLLRDAAPGALTAQELEAALAPLRPRLYSIASSPLAAADAVHLTVAMVHWVAAGRARDGVCSTYLGLRAAAGAAVEVYLHVNRNFRLPDDDRVPIVMIGPGTGIAPFRAFLQERQARERGRGAELAVLRQPEPYHRFSLPRRVGSMAAATGPSPASPPPSRATRATRCTSSTGLPSMAPSCSAGWRRAPTCTCAGMPSGWRRTWTRRCGR